MNGSYFIVMESIWGFILWEVLIKLWVWEFLMLVVVVLEIVCEILVVSDYVYNLCDVVGYFFDIVYCDILFLNVMLVDIGVVKVLDFGIVWVVDLMEENDG